jgi:hypothetical protein
MSDKRMTPEESGRAVGLAAGPFPVELVAELLDVIDGPARIRPHRKDDDA